MEIIGFSVIFLGLFVILSGLVGFIRMPDFYTKLHAAGMIESCGAPLCLIGLAFLQDNYVSSLKLILSSILIIFLSPVATHALAKASLNHFKVTKHKKLK